MCQRTLSVGDRVPDFTLPSTTGETMHLYAALERSAAVLFFYVKAFTPVCMTEVCSFRDNLALFQGLGAAVFGISSDSMGLSKKFAEHHNLPFPLLVDSDGRVRKLFGVEKVLGLLPGRSTYVIGQDRNVKEIIKAGFNGSVHVHRSLDVLRSVNTD